MGISLIKPDSLEWRAIVVLNLIVGVIWLTEKWFATPGDFWRGVAQYLVVGAFTFYVLMVFLRRT